MSCAHFIPDKPGAPTGTCAKERFPHGRTSTFYCNSGRCHLRLEETEDAPSAATLAARALKAGAKWAASGFSMATDEQQAQRRSICDECPMWDATAFGGRGKCRKCGCGGLKLKLATEKCPLGKW